ncbi:MAG TPA: SHOCT domain-containing protein [Thermodesulfobacteriaceae bacterium]|nr:SHOCT domain-containing protein [Thermodesulfobacteriaceae bacterium]
MNQITLFFLWIGIGLVLFMGVYALNRRNRKKEKPMCSFSSPFSGLHSQFKRGEITREEYERKLQHMTRCG